MPRWRPQAACTTATLSPCWGEGQSAWHTGQKQVLDQMTVRALAQDVHGVT
ncbi:hypothetical protein HaLaN_00802, partial [Haematococcus lacustris]